MKSPYIKDLDESFCFSGDESDDVFDAWDWCIVGDVGVDGGRALLGSALFLLESLHCRMNWTSFEYSPHFIKI